MLLPVYLAVNSQSRENFCFRIVHTRWTRIFVYEANDPRITVLAGA